LVSRSSFSVIASFLRGQNEKDRRFEASAGRAHLAGDEHLFGLCEDLPVGRDAGESLPPGASKPLISALTMPTRYPSATRASTTLPGYDPDIAKNRAEARKIMRKLGYGPDNRLAVTLSSRNIPAYRGPRGGTCTQPYVKGLVTMINSIYNGYRMEDVWLDK
jgi:hypothetical protein